MLRASQPSLWAEISAFIRLNAPHSALRACLAEFQAMPEIVEVHRITGVDCFIVKVVVFKMSELEAAIDRIARFGPVTTSVVLASYAEKPITPPPEAQGHAKTRKQKSKHDASGGSGHATT
jgi:DNA-binding Lrp family transcriptional regulator